MAETLGSLCDKLTIVKLKQWHTNNELRRKSLMEQEQRLHAEIDDFVALAIGGRIPFERLTFAANKVYAKEGNDVSEVKGSMGEIIARLAGVNCTLWHVQEKVYEFEKVPPDQKDGVVKQLALLNLERTTCIDEIDNVFRTIIESGRSHASQSS